MEQDMMSGLLSDTDIRMYFKNGINIYTDGKDGIHFDLDKQLHVGSIDLHFRHDYKRFHLDGENVLTYDLLKKHKYTIPYELSVGERLRIEPGEIVLTTSLEIVNLSEEFAGIITGRSSIAKLGVMIHCCQEFIHPGHGQAIPLQIVNLSPYPVELDLDVPICQIVFFKLLNSASEKYIERKDAKYAKEIKVIDSKIADECKDNSNEQKTKKFNIIKWLEKTRETLNKYFAPMLPTIISVLVITPIITAKIIGKTIGELVSNLPASLVIGVFCVIIYFWLKKGEKK